MSELLLRRDTVLPRGTKIELHVTSYYVIEVGDEVLDSDEHSITFAELEKRFGKYPREAMEAVERDYKRTDGEGIWHLPNAHSDGREFTFPTEYAVQHPWRTDAPYVTLAEALAPEQVEP